MLSHPKPLLYQSLPCINTVLVRFVCCSHFKTIVFWKSSQFLSQLNDSLHCRVPCLSYLQTVTLRLESDHKHVVLCSILI